MNIATNGHCVTKWDMWQQYTIGLSSPQNYIDWSWLYLIGAALQRRVWLGASHQPLFANKYVILIGEPGIGKGLPIREISSFLKHWPLKNRYRANDDKLTEHQKQTRQTMEESFVVDAQKNVMQSKSKGDGLVEAPLYHVAADATTYEALVGYIAKSQAFIDYLDIDDKGVSKIRYYGHCSPCFALQELSSLMRKRTDDTVNLLLGLYDCPIDYEYDTKTQGKDRIRKACVNLIAGTTPSFMQSTFDDKLAGEGFNSRAFYIHAKSNRKNCFFIPELTPQQEHYRRDLLEHIRRLSGLYGQVRVDEETRIYLEEWWDKREKNKGLRANSSTKLRPYYARGQIHVQKLAMAFHFGESLEMFIPKFRFEQAIEFLAAEEKNMHLAIVFDGNNPVAKIGNKIVEMLSTTDRNFAEIYVDCNYLGNRNLISEAIDMLGETKQITSYKKKDEDTDKTEEWFKLI